MRLFFAYIEGEKSSNYTTIIIQANSEAKALELARERASEFPEFQSEETSYDLTELSNEGIEEKVIWMS